MTIFQVESKYENVTKFVSALTRAKAIDIVARETGINPKTLIARKVSK